MSRPPPGAPKEAWREWAARTRADLDVARISEAIVDHLAGWLAERSRILTYLAMEDEIDLEPLRERLPGASFYLTRTPPRGWLTVHPRESELDRHPFGLLQPVPGSTEVSPDRIEVALVPGLAFDRSGVRIGHGLGYFDELLGRLSPRALRVGVTPSACVVDRLPAVDHDVLMTHLATEHGVEEVGSG